MDYHEATPTGAKTEENKNEYIARTNNFFQFLRKAILMCQDPLHFRSS